MNGKRVVEVMERLKITFGLPKIIKVDNGSEFISKVMDEWAHRNGVKLDFRRPGLAQRTMLSSKASMAGCDKNA